MSQRPEWEKRLFHARAVRDCYVAMGNPAPSRPDPEGGLIEVPLRRFNGRIYKSLLAVRGHTSGDYEQCECRYRVASASGVARHEEKT